MTRFAAIVLILILGILLYWFSDTKRARAVSAVYSALVSGDRELDQIAFRASALDGLNDIRRQMNLAPVTADGKIQDAVERFIVSRGSLEEIDLDELFDRIRTDFPGAQYLAATLLIEMRKEDLLDGLKGWTDASGPAYECLTTVLYRDGLKTGCLAILTRRLPAFELEVANREGGRFYNQCPLCGETHALELVTHARTLILTCPDCSRPYDVLASDISGHFKSAPAFLNGFSIPTRERSGRPDLETRTREIWAQVLRRCQYEYDVKATKKGEAWKTSEQTWKDQRGDCEDTAILLADALISDGIDARVAVGWNIHIGQHAWCVARIDNRQFVLETTHQPPRETRLPELLSATEAADEYRPEQLFDRERLYFRIDERKRPKPCADYWSDSVWRRIEMADSLAVTRPSSPDLRSAE